MNKVNNELAPVAPLIDHIQNKPGLLANKPHEGVLFVK